MFHVHVPSRLFESIVESSVHFFLCQKKVLACVPCTSYDTSVVHCGSVGEDSWVEVVEVSLFLEESTLE